MSFKRLLDNASVTKSELATTLGIQSGTISSWKGDPPQYVVAYLELAAKNRECSQFLAWIKRWQK